MWAWLRRLLSELAIDAADLPQAGLPDLRKPGGRRIKLAIVVGHNRKSQGAVSAVLGSEFVFNSANADLIASAGLGAGVDVRVFFRVSQGSYSREIEQVYAEVDAWGADCSVELHFNGAASSRATGSLVLASSSRGSRLLADLIQDAQLDAFGLNDRGVVIRKRHGKRGWLSMYAGKCPAVLIEPGFGSNAGDARALLEGWREFAELLVDAVRQWDLDRTAS